MQLRAQARPLNLKGHYVSEQDTPLPGDEDQTDEGLDPTEAGSETSTPSESAPDSGEKPQKEQKTQFTPEQQEVFNRAIGEKTFKMREAERRAEAAERRAAELEAKLPKSERPFVPPKPDPYDPDYEKKLDARDEAIKAAAAYDAQQNAAKAQREAAERQRQEAEQEELVKSAQSYKERAEKFGLDPAEMQTAGTALAKFGIPDDLTRFILKDDQGPLLTMYLARNPDHLERMQGMSPIQMGAYIAADLKPQLATARTQTKAPRPADVLDGGGSPPTARGPKGATFE